jgi:Protein of unknown function (DUF3570)
MKKICLCLLGLYLSVLHTFGQSFERSDTSYKPRPLRIDEVNLISSYYSQNGDNSAITGGIGTERVVDFSNGLDITWIGSDRGQRKHSLDLGLGYDHHSSASSAYVSETGASKKGGSRFYPSLDWTIENDKKGNTLVFGTYYSAEYNYHSFGLDAGFSKKNKNNGEFTFKLTGYFDGVKQILPSELIPLDTVRSTSGIVTITTASGRTETLNTNGTTSGKRPPIPSKPRNTLTGSFQFSQAINQRMQAALLLDLVYQDGDLGLPFHRVYWADRSVHEEELPSERLKLPIGLRINYFLGDRIILRSYYRYYIDTWGLSAQTASLEVPVKITPFFSLSPFYRYYQQSAIKYFYPFMKATSNDQYYTSNYDLSKFNSNFFGLNIRLAPTGGIFGKHHFNMIEIRYGHYSKNINLHSDVISVNLRFK